MKNRKEKKLFSLTSAAEHVIVYFILSCFIKQVHKLPPLSYSWLSLPLSFSPACLSVTSCPSLASPLFMSLSLSMVTRRHLYKSPCCGGGFLWPRPFGSLSLCLLEAVLAHLEEQGSVSSCGKWPPCGFPRRAPVQHPSGHGVQSGGDGEEVPSGSEDERAELRQAPGSGHEDQPDVSRHPRRGANSPEGEAQPAG